VIPGTGFLFWNGGMRLAFSTAALDDPDYYLLLNDDTFLDPDAFTRLLETADSVGGSGHHEAIAVGSTRDPVTGVPTYGGQNRIARWAPRFALVSPADNPKKCDTMNGNCVLIPRAVARKVGNLSPQFTHAYGDIDYGLRAARAGCYSWIAPGIIGTCVHNSVEGSFRDESEPLILRWRKMLGPKGVPWGEWRAFTSSHCGIAWPVYWIGTYVKFWVKAPLVAARRMLFSTVLKRTPLIEGAASRSATVKRRG
jgi:GT2 family glycosyltransferase